MAVESKHSRRKILRFKHQRRKQLLNRVGRVHYKGEFNRINGSMSLNYKTD